MASVVRIREAPEVRRAAILEQAISLIAERGYDGLTIQELAQRSGLSNPGLLHHFPSKSAVLLAVLRDLESRDTEIMTPLVAAAVDGPADDRSRAAVRQVLRTMIGFCVANPQIARALVELQGESLDASHPGHAWWRRREAQMMDVFVRMLIRHVADPAPVARQLIALIDGLGMQWLRADQGFDLVAEWDCALARLLPEIH